MAYRSLNEFVKRLEKANELSRISAPVSPVLEMTEIADRMVKRGGKALLFENTGTAFPVLINAMASDRRICLALGIDELSDLERSIEGLFHEISTPRRGFVDKLKILPTLKSIASWFPVSRKGRGECQEVVMASPDLNKLPVLTCWPHDGGPFITLPCVHTRDPETGLKNLGMYRMQVFGERLTGMHWHLHKGSAGHFSKYRKSGLKMPVTVTLGGDPAYIYAATAPLPENIDEYILAGFLRRKKVEMVKCLTNDLEVPADVDFVIEGYVDPAEELVCEGPFGDHTGFYSLADYYPRFHVTCITHRKNAIYPATIVGIPPQEDGWIGKATERIFLSPIKMTVAPEVTDMHMPVEGVFHNITMVNIRKSFPGQALKIANAMWGAGQMMFNKILVVCDENVTLTKYLDLALNISRNCDPGRDVHFSRGPVDVLDHASQRFAFGSKMVIDATEKYPEELGEAQGTTTFNNLPGTDLRVDKALIMIRFSEISGVNHDLTGLGIQAVIVAVAKQRPGHLRELATRWVKEGIVSGSGFLLFMDETVNINDLAQVVWLAANNLDPARDCFLPKTNEGTTYPVLFLDGTAKSVDYDHFSRDWPNVIVMDEHTINSIDQKWDLLNLGDFIPSPSLYYRPLVKNSGAVATRG